MKTDNPLFYVYAETVQFQGTLHIPPNSGWVILVSVDVAQPKPTATIGNGRAIPINWHEDVSIGSILMDTYTMAHCCLHSEQVTQVTVYHMMPIRAGI